MEYVSSDTNVWIDFHAISKPDLPFLLDVTYIMYREAIDREILYPAHLKDDLLHMGLIGIEITLDELLYADSLGNKYPQLSNYDRIALAIARCRSITLLTGDNALRKAAANESVNVMGTLGLLDRLYEESRISPEEYKSCLNALEKINGGEVRLPALEITKRLANM